MFNITTCDVIRFVEAIVSCVYSVLIVKFKKIMNKTKVILLVKKNLSFIHAAI